MPDPSIYTYSAVYYLAGSTWYKRAEGWNLDTAQLVYEAPTDVFVWWWDGKTWTPETVYGGGHGGFAGLSGPAALGAAVVDDAASIGTTVLEVALVVGALYGFYLLVKKR